MLKNKGQAGDIPLTMEMLNAGAAAYERMIKVGYEGYPEAIAAEIFYSMLRISGARSYAPSSDLIASSSFEISGDIVSK
ncbi:MAG: hypothetical protein ACR65X_04095 [Methylocystis sp.]